MAATSLDLEGMMTDWCHLIRAEYREMPGLRLTEPQVRRLWNLDAITCEQVLERLVLAKVLRRTNTGAYMRVDIPIREHTGDSPRPDGREGQELSIRPELGQRATRGAGRELRRAVGSGR